MATRRTRERRPGRRKPFRDPKPTILIVCEGDVTEPNYFNGFVRAFQNPRVTIHISEEHGVPLTLVRIAKSLKDEGKAEAKRQNDENLAYDSVWCVYDVDDHPHLHEAQEMAEANDIELAISNPCFELWLLLHFRDNPGMQHRDTIYTKLKDYDPDYEKQVDFARYSAGYDEALKRAERMDKLAEDVQSPGCNPTTGVYRLTEEIRVGKKE